MVEKKSEDERSNKTTNAGSTQSLSPLVYWAQTDKQITLKVDLKDTKVTIIYCLSGATYVIFAIVFLLFRIRRWNLLPKRLNLRRKAWVQEA